MGDTANDIMNKKARSSRSFQAYNAWLAGIIASAAALLIGSIAFSIYFLATYNSTAGRLVTGGGLLLSIVMLVLSVLEEIPANPGSLLSGAVSMTYTTWLVYEAL